MIDRSLGMMPTFGYYFHEPFMRQIVRRGIVSYDEGAPLAHASANVVWCMPLTDLTTDEIARRLGIKPRTAQFHFDPNQAGRRRQ